MKKDIITFTKKKNHYLESSFASFWVNIYLTQDAIYGRIKSMPSDFICLLIYAFGH